MVIYFTGTGNSQYLAELIAKQSNDELIDATHMIKTRQQPDFHSEKPYVFVAPIYAWKLPRLFEKWIRCCHFSGNPKAYFVLTCGSEIGAAANYTKKLCDEIGFTHMGTTEVVMPENYIALFSAPTEQESKSIVRNAKEKTQNLTQQIMSDLRFETKKISLLDHVYSSLVNPLFYRFFIDAKKFYVTDACISCGKCADNCMLNNIELTDSKPVWANDCTHCMACICKCPVSAIEYGSHTKGLRRYICKPEE